jgi:hypothetical protein
MSSLKSFKSEADEIMKYITISEELKEKTLMKIKEEKSRFFRTSLIPAACMVIVLTAVVLWRYPHLIKSTTNETAKGNSQGVNILTAPNGSTLPAQSGNNTAAPSATVVSKDIKTLNEAKEFMGIGILEPSYLPEGFDLKGIQGISNDDSKVRNIWLEYTSGDRTFVISVEQNTKWGSFDGYKTVDIDGREGHLKSFKDNSFESAELRWYIDKNFYTIEGAISGEEALRIAQSLN